MVEPRSIVIDFTPIIMQYCLDGYYYPVFNCYGLPEIIQDATALPLGSAVLQEEFDDFIELSIHSLFYRAQVNGMIDRWMLEDYPADTLVHDLVNEIVIYVERHIDVSLWGLYTFDRWIDPTQTLMLLTRHEVNTNNYAKSKRTYVCNGIN